MKRLGIVLGRSFDIGEYIGPSFFVDFASSFVFDEVFFTTL
jgi:hypothetical protein